MRLSNVHVRRASFAVLTLLLTSTFLGTSYAQGLGGGGLTEKQQLELEYADRLMRFGLASYAKQVIDAMDLPPEIMTIRKIKNHCALGEFEKAEAIVNAQPDKTSQGTWTLRLSLADGYYAWGRFDDAQKIYQGFFDKYPDGPSKKMNQFYLDSAYKYSQMLILMGERKKAANAYTVALKAKAEKYVIRQLQGELAELYLQLGEEAKGNERKAYFKKCSDLTETILYGGQDLWFGKSIVMMAHMRKLTGDVEGAMSLIDDYKKDLLGIDKQLKESATPGSDLTKLSPMAQCRYMIGTVMQEEGERLLKNEPTKRAEALSMFGGAIKHMLNVFVRYPNTAWAPDAGARSEAIKAILKSEFDKEVKVNITDEQWAAVEKAQFTEARVQFNQSQFKEAAASYENVLKVFPESETAVQALGELAQCYIELKEDLLAETTVRYIAERFNKNDEYSITAGDQVIRLAFAYSERGNSAMMRDCYEAFFTFFKKHPRTVGELFRFGEKSLSGKDYENALRYYAMIIEGHEGKPAYYDALSRTAQCYSDLQNADKELETLGILVEKLKAKDNPGHALISAMYRKTTALKNKGPGAVAEMMESYRDIEKLLQDKENRANYQNSQDEAKQNALILQGCMFHRGIADARRKVVSPKVQAFFNKKYGKEIPAKTILNSYYKKTAVKTLLALVDEFPESPFASASLSQVGALQTLLNQPEEAKKVFERLQKEYKDSREAQNVQYVLANSLLQMGRRQEALREFRKMFDAPSGTYQPSQILTAGNEILKAGEYDLAIDAFDQVVKLSKSRAYQEPARANKGKALCLLSKYEEARKVLKAFLDEYPNSGFTVEVCQNFCRATAEVAQKTVDAKTRFDLFNEAVTAMKRARRYAKEIDVKTELDVGVARVFSLKAAAEKEFGDAAKATQYGADAIAAYQSIIMFRDPENEVGVGPHVEDAYVECLPLMIAAEQFDVAFQDASRYGELFPQGKHVLKVRQYLNKARVSGGAAESTNENPSATE